MSFKAGIPVFPSAPEGYSRVYLDDLVRALNIFAEQAANPGNVRGTDMVLTDLPVSGAGLATGSVFNDSGTLKIVLANIGYASAVSAAGAIGTVTVTTA